MEEEAVRHGHEEEAKRHAASPPVALVGSFISSGTGF
jgi:hypothetical protein